MESHPSADDCRPFGMIDLLPDEFAVDILFVKIIGNADLKIRAEIPDAQDWNRSNRGKLQSGDTQGAVLLEKPDRAAFFIPTLVGQFQI